MKKRDEAFFLLQHVPTAVPAQEQISRHIILSLLLVKRPTPTSEVGFFKTSVRGVRAKHAR